MIGYMDKLFVGLTQYDFINLNQYTILESDLKLNELGQERNQL